MAGKSIETAPVVVEYYGWYLSDHGKHFTCSLEIYYYKI